MSKPQKTSLRILMVASEAVPFAKTGGLADVVGALPKQLAQLGCDVRLVMPLYRCIPRRGLKRLADPLGVPVGWGEQWSSVWEGTLPGTTIPVYFLEHHHYFDRDGIYGEQNSEYVDNLERFVFLSRGAFQLCHYLGFYPDIFHAHDWMAALVPVYLNTWERHTRLGQAASVLTIHNLGYQGWFPKDQFPLTQLDWKHFNYLELEAYDKINLLKGGILHTTALTTVSPTYGLEIQTPRFGEGLHGVICSRSDVLQGILNGIDDEIWNPANDPFIPACYDSSSLDEKAFCKAALQKEAGLPVNPDIPVVGIVSRLAAQKGFDVLADTIPRILSEQTVQLVLLGTGEYWAETYFGNLSHYRPDRVQAWIGFDPALAHRIFAGSDFFLIPSHFEPCGLNQLYSQRYGCLPIVHAVGGLEDTVENYRPDSGRGTGFKFYDMHAGSLFDTLGWAVWTYYHRPEHIKSMCRQSMQKDFSWRQPAEQYLEHYWRALTMRRIAVDL